MDRTDREDAALEATHPRHTFWQYVRLLHYNVHSTDAVLYVVARTAVEWKNEKKRTEKRTRKQNRLKIYKIKFI